LHSFGATAAQLPGNKNLRWTIFKIRRATDFSSIISPRRQLRQFHRPPPDSFAGIPNILQKNGFVHRESNSIRASRKIVCGYPVLSATVTAESAEIPKFPRISAAAARRRRVKLKIAIFCGLPVVAGGIPALSLEIQKFSGKFKSSAGNSPKPCEACGC
jgi:hypothetical protein